MTTATRVTIPLPGDGVDYIAANPEAALGARREMHSDLCECKGELSSCAALKEIGQ